MYIYIYIYICVPQSWSPESCMLEDLQADLQTDRVLGLKGGAQL